MVRRKLRTGVYEKLVIAEKEVVVMICKRKDHARLMDCLTQSH